MPIIWSLVSIALLFGFDSVEGILKKRYGITIIGIYATYTQQEL